MHQHFDAPGPAHHATTPAIGGRVVQTQAKVIDDDLLAVTLFRRLIKLRIGIQRKLQNAFVATTEHRQRTVRRRGGNRFVMIEIVAEFRAFFLFTRHHGGDQMGVLPQVITHFCQQRGVFSETLHQDITRAVECGFGVRHAFFRIHKSGGFGFRGMGRLVPQQISQRFKARFDGDLAARAAFGFIRQVEIFEFGFAQRGIDSTGQFVGQFALLADRFQNGLAAVFQFTQVA